MSEGEIAVGDADSVSTSHPVGPFGLLGGGKNDGGWDGSGMSDARLSILPEVTQYNIFSSAVLASEVVGFLDASIRKAKPWADPWAYSWAAGLTAKCSAGGAT